MDQNPIFLSKSNTKSIQENRKAQMEALYCKLRSVIPHQSSKEKVSSWELLGEAESYIKNLRERLEEMKQKKNELEEMKQKKNELKVTKSADFSSTDLNQPRIEVHANGSTLDVILITGLKHHHVFKEAVRILHEESADVVSAAFSVVDQTVFHTINSEIGGSGLECEAARISARLRDFVADDNYSKIMLSEK